jgi:hypothetical protein
VIGIHSPEFDFEKDRALVERFARKFEITHPIFVDNDLAYWGLLGASYWPEFYLVDRQGRIRAKISGEMHEGTAESDAAHHVIQLLLAEPLVDRR